MKVNLGSVFDLFELHKEKEEVKQLRFAELRKEIAVGIADAARG